MPCNHCFPINYLQVMPQSLRHTVSGRLQGRIRCRFARFPSTQTADSQCCGVLKFREGLAVTPMSSSSSWIWAGAMTQTPVPRGPLPQAQEGTLRNAGHPHYTLQHQSRRVAAPILCCHLISQPHTLKNGRRRETGGNLASAAQQVCAAQGQPLACGSSSCAPYRVCQGLGRSALDGAGGGRSHAGAQASCWDPGSNPNKEKCKRRAIWGLPGSGAQRPGWRRGWPLACRCPKASFWDPGSKLKNKMQCCRDLVLSAGGRGRARIYTRRTGQVAVGHHMQQIPECFRMTPALRSPTLPASRAVAQLGMKQVNLHGNAGPPQPPDIYTQQQGGQLPGREALQAHNEALGAARTPDMYT